MLKPLFSRIIEILKWVVNLNQVIIKILQITKKTAKSATDLWMEMEN
jgi:hypothetical protein